MSNMTSGTVSKLTSLRHLFWDFLWDCDERKRVGFFADELVKYDAIHGATELNVHLLLQQLNKVVESSENRRFMDLS